MKIKWFSFVRVTGLLLVLLYHFFKQTFPGGFIGVDVFFTFSGYLITALLIDEFSRSKAIDLLGFLRRRFYRIVPPLVLMVLLTMPFTFFVRKDFVAGIGSQIASALGFTTNLYEIFTGGNYESQFIPHLFVHTWSLAIEVHFYVFWGLLLWFLGKRVGSEKEFRSLVFLLSAGLFSLSFLVMFIRAFFVANFSLIYFSSISHIFPFFLGAVFATLSGIKETTGRFKRNVRLWRPKQVIAAMVGSGLLLFLLSLILDFNHILTYLFGFGLASGFTAVMIYAARVLNDHTSTAKEPFLIQFLSDISYGIYLFHWPFYIIFSQFLPNWLTVVVTLMLSIAFSALSFYVLEPFIAGKTVDFFGLDLKRGDYQKWLAGAFALLTMIMLGIVFTAPKVGAFETNLLVDSLNQANANMNRTHTVAAGDASAISNVGIIGDSVALRSSSAFSELLPEAHLDAAVSRNFTSAYDIFQTQIQDGTLPKTVVLAVGVNSVEGYQENLQRFVNELPVGHRLVLVSPYNAKDGRIPEFRDYEVSLAKKYAYVTLADWYSVALTHPDIWAGTDGVHYSDATPDGAKLYVKTIQKAIQKAAKSKAKPAN